MRSTLPTALLCSALLCISVRAFQQKHTPARLMSFAHLKSVDKPAFAVYLDSLYARGSKLKCPFFRRRATDLIDGLANVWKFIIARHKSLPLYDSPGCLSVDGSKPKLMNLSLQQLSSVISTDWGTENNGKGYYITGHLTREIYRDDCLFDGPDPDMPVRGLRKYLSSASQLFDKRKSRADITSLTINPSSNSIRVSWRIEGVLNLPWHPSMKPWTGSTTYLFDECGLVKEHVEVWDIPVLDAFLSILFPNWYVGEPPAATIEEPYCFIEVEEVYISSPTENCESWES